MLRSVFFIIVVSIGAVVIENNYQDQINRVIGNPIFLKGVSLVRYWSKLLLNKIHDYLYNGLSIILTACGYTQEYAVKLIQEIKFHLQEWKEIFSRYFQGLHKILIKALKYIAGRYRDTMKTGENSESNVHPSNEKSDVNNNRKRQIGRIFTKEELSYYDGSPGSKGLYLGFMGHVFDVKKGREFYGPGGGYDFFSGKDASRAFVTGEFDEKGLTDEIEGLNYKEYLELKKWLNFYHKDYKYIGKLAGRYFTNEGEETDYNMKVKELIEKAENQAKKDDDVRLQFPP